MENMKNQLAAASVAVQGSGWGWLGYNKLMKKLQIATCQNQDPLEPTTGNYIIYLAFVRTSLSQTSL